MMTQRKARRRAVGSAAAAMRESTLATIVDLGALAVACMLTLRLIRRLDTGARGSLTPAPAKAEKVRALKTKLSKLAVVSKNGNSLKLQLNEHELEVSTDVVPPDAMHTTFADVIGLDAIGTQLQRNIILPLTQPEIFGQSKLLRPPKGILLHGPPGTGKTLLAKAVAHEAKFTFICLNPARLLSKWYGESNKLADAYFSLAHKLAPSILFIDEIDCLFRTRGGAHEHEATSMLKAQFLSLWDGLLSASATQVVVIAATNRPDDVDPAVLRRLPLSFEVALPDHDARAAFVRSLLSAEEFARSVDCGAVARATEGYSCSDLEQLCKTAAMRALEEALQERIDEEDAPTAAPAPMDAAANVTDEAAPDVAAVESIAASAPAADETDTGVGAGAASRAPLQLRQLTLDDFMRARAVVRPTRGRFAGVHHDVHSATPPPVAADLYDNDLYN